MSAAEIITGPAIKASARERRRALLYTGGAVLGLLFLRLFNPVTSGFYPPCPLQRATGLYCPGCGVTRALYHLVHGHAAQAFAMNPLFVLLTPIIAYVFVSYVLLGLRGRGLPMIFAHPKFTRLLFWIAILFGILRNIPLYPFNLLAPHNL